LSVCCFASMQSLAAAASFLPSKAACCAPNCFAVLPQTFPLPPNPPITPPTLPKPITKSS
jgi:hypothetical protein